MGGDNAMVNNLMGALSGILNSNVHATFNMGFKVSLENTGNFSTFIEVVDKSVS